MQKRPLLEIIKAIYLPKKGAKKRGFMKKNNSGFTFVELAISMVIIGILIVGVLAGQVLIQSAKIRAVVSETSNFQSMYNLFVEKYQAPPGDMADANTTVNAAAVNGNGDGIIEWTWDGARSEGARAFQHMMLAEMYSGNLTNPGIVNTGTSQAILGNNAPASKFNGVGFYWDNNGTRNIIGAGAQQANNECSAIIFSGDAARDLDNKMDDGVPNTGRMRGVGGTCAGATYPVGNAPACSFTMRVN